MKRVVVTGIGIVSSLGLGIDKNYSALLSGDNGIKKVDREKYGISIASLVEDFNVEDFGIDKKDLKKFSRNIVFGLVASKLAIDDSKIELSKLDPFEIACYVSSGIGGIEVVEDGIKNIDKKRISPFTMPKILTNMLSANIALHHNIKGPNKCINTACASGTSVIGDAFEVIKSGKAKVVIAGASEASVTPFITSAFKSMKAINDSEDITASRPFSKDRNGFVLGEGAGILILEDLDHATKRNAKIYAEIVSYSETCDAHHITTPREDGESYERAIKNALKYANISIDEIDYINAHGTSTKLNDATETKVFNEVFKDHAKNLLISSIKGSIGHTLAAAGAIECGIVAKTIKEEKIVPTINFTTRDEDCNLNYVTQGSVSKKVKYALTSSLGFGGHNSVIIMKKYE